MKARISLSLAGLLIGSLGFAADAAQKVDVTVGGMVCSFCAQGITKKFKARPEVEAVKVTLADQKGTSLWRTRSQRTCLFLAELKPS